MMVKIVNNESGFIICHYNNPLSKVGNRLFRTPEFELLTDAINYCSDRLKLSSLLIQHE